MILYAICYTKPGTTVVFWLNRFHSGGFIWSPVRSRHIEGHLREEQEWNQPSLRFSTRAEAQHFIVQELASNPLARVVPVEEGR